MFFLVQYCWMEVRLVVLWYILEWDNFIDVVVLRKGFWKSQFKNIDLCKLEGFINELFLKGELFENV